MIKAIIFDMDGVLIDSEPFWRQSEVEVFSSIGVSISEADTLATMGLRIDEVVEFWFKRKPWEGPSLAQVSNDIVEEVIRRILDEGKAKPGIASALKLFQDMNLRICLASSSSSEIIDAVISKLQLSSYLEFCQSAEHEVFGKPHPAVYLSAIRRLGLKAEECLAIEDSPAGVESAKRAGAYCICIPEADLDRERVKRADHILPSLAAITADHLEYQ